MSDYKEENDGLEALSEVISMAGFDFPQWREQEESIIRPRLEEAGFTTIFFENLPGPRDRFGTVTRLVNAYDSDGNFRQMFYG